MPAWRRWWPAENRCGGRHASGAYLATKVAAEATARRLPDDGAPVVVVQPGSVLGPDDPHFGDGLRALRDVVRGRYPPHVVLPASQILPVTRAAPAVQRFLPFHLPFEYEGALITGYGTRCDDTRARQELA